ncbi:MAG: TonB family protein [Gammaproteobacteria bacterium]
MSQLLRIGVSLCVAVILVGAFALFGINSYFEQPPVNQVAAFRVETATAEELAAARRITEPEQAKPEPPPPPPVDRDLERDGFVQVQFEVTPEGRAANAEVVGAMPAGYFESEAVSRIERKRFVPERIDGQAVSSIRTEIVEFKYVPVQTRAVEP